MVIQQFVSIPSTHRWKRTKDESPGKVGKEKNFIYIHFHIIFTASLFAFLHPLSVSFPLNTSHFFHSLFFDGISSIVLLLHPLYSKSSFHSLFFTMERGRGDDTIRWRCRIFQWNHEKRREEMRTDDKKTERRGNFKVNMIHSSRIWFKLQKSEEDEGKDVSQSKLLLRDSLKELWFRRALRAISGLELFLQTRRRGTKLVKQMTLQTSLIFNINPFLSSDCCQESILEKEGRKCVSAV